MPRPSYGSFRASSRIAFCVSSSMSPSVRPSVGVRLYVCVRLCTFKSLFPCRNSCSFGKCKFNMSRATKPQNHIECHFDRLCQWSVTSCRGFSSKKKKKKFIVENSSDCPFGHLERQILITPDRPKRVHDFHDLTIHSARNANQSPPIDESSISIPCQDSHLRSSCFARPVATRPLCDSFPKSAFN